MPVPSCLCQAGHGEELLGVASGTAAQTPEAPAHNKRVCQLPIESRTTTAQPSHVTGYTYEGALS